MIIPQLVHDNTSTVEWLFISWSMTSLCKYQKELFTLKPIKNNCVAAN